MTITAPILIQPGKMTWDEFQDLEIPNGDTSSYELINGEIVKRASPITPHQQASFLIGGYFGMYNMKKKAGSFYNAPLDVCFDEYNAGVLPDLMFISNERDFIIEHSGIFGAPDLIVEILAHGSIGNDRCIKMDLYERFAVKEYWMVDTRYQTVEVYRMENDRYRLFSFAEKKGEITSSVLQDFSLGVEKIF